MSQAAHSQTVTSSPSSSTPAPAGAINPQSNNNAKNDNANTSKHSSNAVATASASASAAQKSGTAPAIASASSSQIFIEARQTPIPSSTASKIASPGSDSSSLLRTLVAVTAVLAVVIIGLVFTVYYCRRRRINAQKVREAHHNAIIRRGNEFKEFDQKGGKKDELTSPSFNDTSCLIELEKQNSSFSTITSSGKDMKRYMSPPASASSNLTFNGIEVIFNNGTVDPIRNQAIKSDAFQQEYFLNQSPENPNQFEKPVKRENTIKRRPPPPIPQDLDSSGVSQSSINHQAESFPTSDLGHSGTVDDSYRCQLHQESQLHKLAEPSSYGSSFYPKTPSLQSPSLEILPYLTSARRSIPNQTSQSTSPVKGTNLSINLANQRKNKHQDRIEEQSERQSNQEEDEEEEEEEVEDEEEDEEDEEEEYDDEDDEVDRLTVTDARSNASSVVITRSLALKINYNTNNI
ncbi:expressed protein [Phakopsora pachyrhizi]|uniref:Expressed protein n=1 Tax=Phakopsora pachyrhizi TaxID=170000 RepID=A0AAV0AXD7_PHAPC|nr:expressed protein [Phakopsora pachyrhizi]